MSVVTQPDGPRRRTTGQRDTILRDAGVIAPEPRSLHKSSIRLDAPYQRDELASKIREIALTFNWILFNTVVVAEREGELWAVDGKQRISATLKLENVSMLPCMWFRSEGIEQEARIFLGLQSLRRPVTALQKFDASVIARDRAALEAKALVESFGYSIYDSGGTARSIRCVANLLRCRQIDGEAFDRVWPVIVAAHNGQPIKEGVMTGLWYLERNGDESLTAAKWMKRIQGIGAEQLQVAANKAAAFYGRAGDRSMASGILRAINAGLRNRFTVRGEAEIVGGSSA